MSDFDALETETKSLYLRTEAAFLRYHGWQNKYAFIKNRITKWLITISIWTQE